MGDRSQVSATARDVERWRRNAEAEGARAALYRALSEAEADTPLGRTLRRVSELEQAQAAYWAGRLPVELRPPAPRLDLRGRVLLWLARRFGTRAVLPLLAASAVRGAELALRQPDAAAVVDQELEVAVETASQAGEAALGREHRHPITASGTLRAAVFGINDGLVSNLSLVMGVAGAAPPQTFILLAGLAGLLAGAFSMAAGEFISVLSQRELLGRQLELARLRLARAPAEVRASLARRYQEKGLPASQAEALAGHLLADRERALETLAREELGIDPDDLGSPHLAAAASFLSFALGALIPIVPFMVGDGWAAILASAAVSAVALFLVGVGISLFTARHPLLGGARMLAIGAAAASVTFLIGRLVGIGGLG